MPPCNDGGSRSFAPPRSPPTIHAHPSCSGAADASRAALFVRVALPLPLDQTFTYAVPPALAEGLVAGSRVVVPFGRRVETGVVVELADQPDTDATRDILDVLDDGAAATDELLALTRWVADYYVCGWGEALRAALPTGLDVATEHRISRTGLAPGDWLFQPQAGPLLEALLAHPYLTMAGLRQHAPHATLALVRRLERAGLVHLETGVRAPRVSVRHENAVRPSPAFRSPAALRDARAQVRGQKQQALLDTLAHVLHEGQAAVSQKTLLARAGATAASLRTLADQGIIEIFKREVMRTDGLDEAPASAPPIALHSAQEAAHEALAAALHARQYQTFLLHGVTGSGKTEVYIAALKETLAQGRTAIVLVPEIALTPQTVRRFRAHFGDRIAVLHSRMSLGERYDAWRALREGRFPVVIGPRSAIFAPLENLGLVVVDEEHEPSYKQFDPAPRYHARDVAVYRAHLNGAVCVLGSATPALESWHNAQTGKYTYLAMPERVPQADGALAQLPPVEIVDLTLEHKKHQLDGALSKRLVEAINMRLERGEQTILLQNRRGYAPVLQCESCGWTPFCRDCSVTLTYHKARRQLRCHYCGRAHRRPPACPRCSASDFALLGAGTQRVEEELAERFPQARVARMDLDTTGTRNAHHRILERFGRGEADVLLGTQMVAKGLDFPRVTLVGVVNADTGLRLPDFRAEERTFQLLTQVAGRAGRADLKGEVILQTRSPKHAALRFARQHDYHGFAEHALRERQLLGYPPFGRIVGIEFRGRSEEATLALARDWTALLRDVAAGACEVYEPQPALVSRLKRFYRLQTFVRVPRGAPPVQTFLRATLAAFGPSPSQTRVVIDVDAVGLY